MGRLKDAFEKAASENRAALVIYLCAGDPSMEATPRLIAAAAEAGADIIEVGVPFSDPSADGPAIQRASERALAGGASMTKVLAAVREARAQVDVPVLLFGYYNPILAYGEQRLAADAKAAGVDGFLVVDLPPEEAGDLFAAARAESLDLVPLLAPTSHAGRISQAAKLATGFIYYVSLTGVTGAAAVDLASAAESASKVERETGCPVALGFGVKTAEDVAKVAARASGVVVGSAVVQVIEAAEDVDAAVEGVSTLVASLAAGLSR